MPFRNNDARTDRWALETLDELLSIEDSNLVEIVPAVVLLREHGGPTVADFASHAYPKERGGRTETTKFPNWSKDARLNFQHLTVEMLAWQNMAHQLRLPPEQELKEAGYLHAWLFWTPIVNAPNMLQHLLDQIVQQQADVDVETNQVYANMEEMCADALDLGCDVVFNCTGLGARALCDDEADLTGGRGVTLQYNRATVVRRLPVRESPYGDNRHDAVIMADEPPWGSETEPCYMIPRGDKIVVGGSFLKGDTEISVRDEERARLVRNASLLGIDTTQSSPVAEWTGFRPYRSTVRCEIDRRFSTKDLTVIHNYGHGGSGWTINAGTARDAVNLILP